MNVSSMSRVVDRIVPLKQQKGVDFAELIRDIKMEGDGWELG